MTKIRTISVPAATLDALRLPGPISAWPDSGDWRDDDDWVVGIAKRNFENDSAYVVKKGSRPPSFWGTIAERVPAATAQALAGLLNAVRAEQST